MRRRWLFVAASVAASASTVGACAAADESGDLVPLVPPVTLEDAASEVAQDEPDAPCEDCELFPDTCSADVLCPNGLFGGADGIDLRTQIRAIRGRGANDVWAVGAVGTVAHFDGTSWRTSDLGSHETQRALWLSDTGEIVLGSFARLYTRGLDTGDLDAGVSAGGWTLRAVPPLPAEFRRAWPKQLRAAWAPPSASSLWLATWDEEEWSSPSPTRPSGLWRLRKTGASGFEIVAGVRGDDCPHACNQLSSVYGLSVDTIWAVGDVGANVRVDGADGDATTVTSFNSQTWNALYGVWAASASDVWSVGASGVVRHYRGDSVVWDIVDVPTAEDLNAVWGTSASDVWAVGNAGVVLHYDGDTWSRVKIAGLGRRRPDLYTVWSPGPGHVWIGGHGVILSLGGNP